MQQVIRLFSESLKLTLQQLWANKLRTFLSLFGISIGIFSIISILTAVDALKNNINDSINSLGDNILFVNKWAWTFDGPNDYPWWKYFERPNVKYNDFIYTKNKSTLGEYFAFEKSSNSQPELAYKDNKTHSGDVVGVSADYAKVFQFNLSSGRFLSAMEVNNGIAVCVIGEEVAEKLFDNVPNPVNYELKIAGKPVKIIGIIEKKGEDLLGFNFDKSVLVPLSYYNRYISGDDDNANTTLEVRSKEGVSLDELRNELIGIMRASRKLRPKQDDDFSINEMSVLANGFNDLYYYLGIIGGIIGGFATLVGGFGIANIMFVTVSERKPLIGIKKALGAKNRDILLEFLFEAIFLCVLGGLIGLGMVAIGTHFATEASGMDFALNAKNVNITFIISFALGILSGIIPAMMAAKLDPVEAIRS
ncbi:MAG: ABC transporter permease [Chitinophagales bacterium]|nr:ABC transporter permease [Chitinophagales bacterium]